MLAENGNPRAAGQTIAAFLERPGTTEAKMRQTASAMGDYAASLAAIHGLPTGDAVFLAEVAARAYKQAGRDAEHIAAIALQGDLLAAGGASIDEAGGRYAVAGMLAEQSGMSAFATHIVNRHARNLFERGDLAAAKQVALRATELGQPRRSADEKALAETCQLLLEVTLRTEEFEETLTVANVARQLFERYHMTLHAADVDRLEAEARWRLSDMPGASTAIMRARSMYAAAEDFVKVAICDFQRARMLLTPRAEGRELLSSARAVFIENSQTVEAARCDIVLGQYEREAENLEATEELTVAAFETFTSYGMASDAARAQYALGEVRIARGRYGEAIDVLKQARRTHLGFGECAAVANCDTLLAEAFWRTEDQNSALGAALAALSTFDRQRYSMTNPQSREVWAEQRFSLFGIALDAAALRGDNRLIAELAECARAQSIPAAQESDDGYENPDETCPFEPLPHGIAPLIQRARVEPLPLQRPSAIRVRGSSALANAEVSPASRYGTPIDLEAVATEVGGDRAWWWGITQQTPDVLWWSLIGPNGQVEAGRIDYSGKSPARRAMSTLYESLPLRAGREDDLDFTRRIAGGALADPGTEEALAEELGAALLPPPLRTLLAIQADDDPLSLVVAPNPNLAPLPLGLIGIGDGRRLVDAAILRSAPSAAFLAHVAEEAARGLRLLGGPGPVVCGLFDPDRNNPLRHAARLADEIGSGEKLIGERATKEALAKALKTAAVRPGAASVLVYCGHARTPWLAGTSLLCLHNESGQPSGCPIEDCCGGAPLTATELCGQQPGQENMRYPMPGRVLL